MNNRETEPTMDGTDASLIGYLAVAVCALPNDYEKLIEVMRSSAKMSADVTFAMNRLKYFMGVKFPNNTPQLHHLFLSDVADQLLGFDLGTCKVLGRGIADGIAYRIAKPSVAALVEPQYSWDKSWREWPERLTEFEVRLINSALALRDAWPPPMTSPPRREDWEKAAKALHEFQVAADEYLD